jgi:hypothetical protein
MSHRTRLRTLILPVVAAAALGIAACGGDDEPSERAAPPALATPDTDLELRQLEAPATGELDGETPADAAESIDQLRQNFRDVAARQLKASGLSDEQVDCVLPKIEAAVDDANLEAAMAGDAEALTEAGIKAAEECGADLG